MTVNKSFVIVDNLISVQKKIKQFASNKWLFKTESAYFSNSLFNINIADNYVNSHQKTITECVFIVSKTQLSIFSTMVKEIIVIYQNNNIDYVTCIVFEIIRRKPGNSI